jgi:hypothetical protein
MHAGVDQVIERNIDEPGLIRIDRDFRVDGMRNAKPVES